jgi:transcriptional regulator with XRE-family HTH domain
MATRWNRFYKKQMANPRLRDLVDRELENLQLGVQIARLRASERLSQTKLAALADMSAPKVSAIENEPRNLTVATLIRLAHALGSRVEIKFVQQKKGKASSRRRSMKAVA